MAAQNGYGGTLTLADTACETNVHSWSLDYVADPLETTDFTSTGFRTFIPGLKSWSGSFEVYLDGTTQPEASDVGATAAALVLTAASGRTWSGNAILTGIHPSVSVDGVNSMTCDFQGTGAITIA